jgi:hypothetical protein
MRKLIAAVGPLLLSACSAGGAATTCPSVAPSPVLASATPTSEPSSPKPSNAAEIARSIAEALPRHDFAAVVSRLDATMREKLSAQKLRDTWLDATRGAGDFKSLHPEPPRTRDGWPTDEFVAEFAQREVEIKVTVRPETGEVAGLWIWRRKVSDDARDRTVPDGWSLSGGGAADYRFTLDADVRHAGKASAKLAPIMDGSSRYGTMMQAFDAAPYRRKRVRMSAFVRGEDLSGRADGWARAQGSASPAEGPGLGGGACALSGTFEWKPCEIVFEVPGESVQVEVGFGLAGSGTLWVDDVKLEIAPKGAGLTGAHRLAAPTNLDFEGVRTEGARRPSDGRTVPASP